MQSWSPSEVTVGNAGIVLELNGEPLLLLPKWSYSSIFKHFGIGKHGALCIEVSLFPTQPT